MKKFIIWVLGPILFVIFTILPDFAGISPQAKKVLALTVFMAYWWISESVPIPITSLLPILLLPLFGVISAKQITMNYANHLIFLFLGGYFISKAFESQNLHKKIALFIINKLGYTPSRIILGFMISTALLSMWMSNTATTVMMLPIGLSVIKDLKLNKNDEFIFSHALLLGIAYSATIGGVGTLIGSPPNLIFAGIYEKLTGFKFTFVSWMAFGIPLTVIFIPITWLYLTKFKYKIR